MVFMHNIPVGHERSMVPVGRCHTDASKWDSFVGKCQLIVNMTFEEGILPWHAANEQAVDKIVQVISHQPEEH